MRRNPFDIDDKLLLVRAVCHKDRETLVVLYLKYAPQVRSYVASQAGSAADIEDLVQHVFLQVCQGKGHYDSATGVEPYIFGIAKNVIRQYRREKERSPQLIPVDSLSSLPASYQIKESIDPEARILARRLRRVLRQMETSLPPKAREAVRLRFVEGLSVKEAAAKAGCSTAAFYARLERAIKTLRKMHGRPQ